MSQVNIRGAGFVNITTGATTVVKSGAGVLRALIINTAAAGAITLYDSTTAGGTKIGTIRASAPEGTYTYGVGFSRGLTIVTAAASDVTVVFD